MAFMHHPKGGTAGYAALAYIVGAGGHERNTAGTPCVYERTNAAAQLSRASKEEVSERLFGSKPRRLATLASVRSRVDAASALEATGLRPAALHGYRMALKLVREGMSLWNEEGHLQEWEMACLELRTTTGEWTNFSQVCDRCGVGPFGLTGVCLFSRLSPPPQNAYHRDQNTSHGIETLEYRLLGACTDESQLTHRPQCLLPYASCLAIDLRPNLWRLHCNFDHVGAMHAGDFMRGIETVSEVYGCPDDPAMIYEVERPETWRKANKEFRPRGSPGNGRSARVSSSTRLIN